MVEKVKMKLCLCLLPLLLLLHQIQDSTARPIFVDIYTYNTQNTAQLQTYSLPYYYNLVGNAFWHYFNRNTAGVQGSTGYQNGNQHGIYIAGLNRLWGM